MDTRRNTVYLINWYERSDFAFHVYTYEDRPGTDASVRYLKPRLITAELAGTAAVQQPGLRQSGPAVHRRRGAVLRRAGARRVVLSGNRLPATRQSLPAEHPRAGPNPGRHGPGRYELPIFAYAVDTEDTPALGLADVNYVDGTQS